MRQRCGGFYPWHILQANSRPSKMAGRPNPHNALAKRLNNFSIQRSLLSMIEKSRFQLREPTHMRSLSSYFLPNDCDRCYTENVHQRLVLK